jgi:hypothetical protein
MTGINQYFRANLNIWLNGQKKSVDEKLSGS